MLEITLTKDCDVQTTVKDACSAVIEDKEILAQCVLCICEIVDNIIRHSFTSSADKTIHVSIARREASIRCEISHSGECFKPIFNYKEIVLEEICKQGRGLGLYMIHKIMDEVIFEERNGACFVILKKN